jgi:S-DNA-T family DNA segregation ATPase FtsK/SpoIIIE
MRLTREKLHDIFVIIFIVIGLIILLGLISSITGRDGGEVEKIISVGRSLEYAVQILYSHTFGFLIFFLMPVFLFIEGYCFIKMKPFLKHLKNFSVYFLFSLVMSVFAGVISYGKNFDYFKDESDKWESIGAIGFRCGDRLIGIFGYAGSLIILSALFLIILLFVFDFRVNQMIKFLFYPFVLIIDMIFKLIKKIRKFIARRRFNRELKRREEERLQALAEQKPQSEPDEPVKKVDLKSEQEDKAGKKEPEKEFDIEQAVLEKSVDFKAKVDKKYKYIPPDIDFLNETKSNVNIIEDEQKLKEVAMKLEEKLGEFSLEARVVKINPGPVITQYEIELAKGVKVSRVTSLEDDLAMALKAKSIRIVAPIPGKGTIGIEIPNSNPSIVYLKSIIASEKFINHKSKLAIALGKLISGENYILDLAKTPHLLIAGSTGSGKSVCINGLIISLLYRATPEEVQFCMIDPKKVELSVYSGLLKHHLLKIEGIDDPVVTSPEDAVRLLEALVTEMESRYDLLNQSGTRNIEEYNTMIESGELKFNEIASAPFRKLPYIVCILDEYGDLMMTSGKTVEDPICRLAQMARAIGIHLVLATQRPSVKVVTGAIKANFPTRIAFRVISQIDSRTILDGKGAESLLGKGDMLLIPPGESDLVRIQNALVETKEINRIVKHIGEQPDNFDKISIKAKPSSAQIAAMNGDDDFAGSGDRDALYQDAKRLVIRTGMASVSMLQRGLSVGYARAGGLIDQLERDGVVGPHQGSKSREVLVSSDED